MITRVWHGTTKAVHAEAYLEYLQESGIKDYRSISGNLGAEIWRQFEGDICHFWTISRWKDYDSIIEFAGNDYEKARYYPRDREFLIEFEENVVHCETYQF